MKRLVLGLLALSLTLPTTLWARGPQKTTTAEDGMNNAAGAEPEAPKEKKLSVYGYGEFHYNNHENADDVFDLHRFVIGVGYDFTDRIRLRTEFEFEHGFTEPYIEYAYMDFDIAPAVNVRAGVILLPIGYLNQHHEPPLFYSVERPEIYSRIIPSTWMEGGAGLFGEIIEGLEYQIYAHTSLDFNDGFMGDTGFSGSNGLRGGRQKVAEAVANDFAGSARLQYTGVTGLRLGTSAFVGQTSQADPRVDRGLVSLIEADAKYSIEGIELEGLVAVVFNPEGGAMTTAQRADGNIGATDVIGTRMLGFMFEGAYHLFHHAWKDAPVDLVAFARFEWYDTNHDVGAGFAALPALERQTITTGLSFMPIPNVAIKADYSFRDNDAGTANDQFNLGIGYYF